MRHSILFSAFLFLAVIGCLGNSARADDPATTAPAEPAQTAAPQTAPAPAETPMPENAPEYAKDDAPLGVYPADLASGLVNGETMPEYADNTEDIEKLLKETELSGGAEIVEQHYDPIPVIGQSDGIPNAEEMTLQAAMMQALSNNISLKSQRMNPKKSELSLRAARSRYFPDLKVGASYNPLDLDYTKGVGNESSGSNASATLMQELPTGTNITLSSRFSDSYNNPERTRSSGNWGFDHSLSVTQNLLRGRSLDINMIGIRNARTDIEISRFQLQDNVENTIVNTENKYWDLVLARERVKIYTDNLRITKEQLKLAEERIKVGKLADVEVAQSRASVLNAHISLMDAHNNYELTKLDFLAFLNMSYGTGFDTQLALEEMPDAAPLELDSAEAHVQLGLKRRPDINQALLSLRKSELSLKQTENGLLPDLGLTIAVGQSNTDSRYANDWTDTDKVNVRAGLNFSHTLGNYSAKIGLQQSKISLEQQRLALANQKLQIEINIRTAYLNLLTSHKRISASRLALKQTELALQTQREKFKVGTATTLDVALSEYNYINSRNSYATTVISTLKNTTALYRADGSLLERRGVVLQK